MTTSPTILIAGLGDLGSVALELLAREHWPGRIIASSRTLGRAEASVNLARLGAIAQGMRPNLEAASLDLDDVDRAAEFIRQLSPDVILSTATRQSWWTPYALPAEPRDLLTAAGFGAWLPIHLILSLKLMRALRLSEIQARTLIAPFPDVSNCVLSRLGLEPTCGVGNIAEIVPKIESLAANKLGVPIDDVSVTLVAHHSLQGYVSESPADKGPPFFLRIMHAGTNVTDAIGGLDFPRQAYPIPSGRRTHFLTASSIVRLMAALTSKEVRLHAPGPEGLPGGYPVLVGPRGVRVPAIKNLSRRAAIEINEVSHRFDGIEAIGPDGTVIFSERTVEIMSKELGYHCQKLPPSEIEGRADELLERFREYAGRHGLSAL